MTSILRIRQAQSFCGTAYYYDFLDLNGEIIAEHVPLEEITESLGTNQILGVDYNDEQASSIKAYQPTTNTLLTLIFDKNSKLVGFQLENQEFSIKDVEKLNAYLTARQLGINQITTTLKPHLRQKSSLKKSSLKKNS